MTIGFRQKMSDGRRAMAHLVHIWHERNGWSHKVLPALAECLDLGSVHSSQLSNLRNGKLASPRPEVFLALAQANKVLFSGTYLIKDTLAEIHPELLKVLSESSLPLVGDDGNPLSAGVFLEIFLGLAPLPKGFDWFIEDQEASILSAALADYLCNKRPWRYCRDELMHAYVINKPERRERFAEVMAGLRDYTAVELDGELLDLYATYVALGREKCDGVVGFLDILRKRSLNSSNNEISS